jgi:transposase InsO family protein
MPGKKITDQQVKIYKQMKGKVTQQVAAARAGISIRSARRIDKSQALPSQKKDRRWRTRKDPLSAVWEQELEPLLATEPGLQAKTLLEELQRRHGQEAYGDEVLRTLQRRVRAWRALNGDELETFFAQNNPPGRLGLSDFTVANKLNVTLAGETFDHRLYQFVLAFSGWRHAEPIVGGESFESLSQGLQNALWALGGVPQSSRTDSLSAAFNNLAQREELTKRYKQLCEHYGMESSRNNLGQSHENGSVESRQGTLKNALEQALLLRGHRDFADLESYRRFVGEVVARMNRRIHQKLVQEQQALKPLPPRRTSEYEEIEARVTKFGTASVKRILYSVPSRLIGRALKFRIYADRIEGWDSGVRVFEGPRGTYDPDSRRGKMIDYRHLIGTLHKKPGAFTNWSLRDHIFPRTEYRQMWDYLCEHLSPKDASKRMVGLLYLAAKGACEAQLAGVLVELMACKQLPELEVLEEQFAPRKSELPSVNVKLPTLDSYDTFLGVAA